MNRKADARLWHTLTLREALVIGFCAALIAASGLIMRIPLHLPGHRLLPVAFFLLLGRAVVPRRFTGTAIALVAAILSLSLGRHDLIGLVKTCATGVAADIIALAFAAHRSVLLSALAGAVIGASWLPLNLVADLVAGMDTGLAIPHSLLKSASAILFAAIGGVFVPPVVRRLEASGVLLTSANASPNATTQAGNSAAQTGGS